MSLSTRVATNCVFPLGSGSLRLPRTSSLVTVTSSTFFFSSCFWNSL